MAKFKYLVQELSYVGAGYQALQDELDTYGAKGWQLVQLIVGVYETTPHLGIFKRKENGLL